MSRKNNYDIAILLENSNQIIAEQVTNCKYIPITKQKNCNWSHFFNSAIINQIAPVVYCLENYEIIDAFCIEKIMSKYLKFGDLITAVYSDDNNVYNSFEHDTKINTPIAINTNIKSKIFNDKTDENMFNFALTNICNKSIIYHIPEQLIRK